MDISSLTNISSDYLNQIAQQNRLVTTDDDSFSSVLSSAMNMVSETNDLQNNAQSRPGPRLADGAKAMYDFVYGE